MRRLPTILAAFSTVIALFVLAPAASAQVQGTYCSAAASDGVWAFAYGNQNVFVSCNEVQNALFYRTRAPVVASTRGYYWLNAVNTVWVSCFNGSTSFYGVGGYPLTNAYNYANWRGGQGCTFAVN